MTTRPPSIGRIVHYIPAATDPVQRLDVPLAAIVTGLDAFGNPNLRVIANGLCTEDFWRVGVVESISTSAAAGSWQWPVMV